MPPLWTIWTNGSRDSFSFGRVASTAVLLFTLGVIAAVLGLEGGLTLVRGAALAWSFEGLSRFIDAMLWLFGAPYVMSKTGEAVTSFIGKKQPSFSSVVTTSRTVEEGPQPEPKTETAS